MLKLYTNSPAHFFYYTPKMTADYCGYPVQVVVVSPEQAESKEIKDKKGSGHFPFLETADGKVIFESVAIAQYIARAAGQQGFLGQGAFEEAQVEQWVAFTASTITPIVRKVAGHYWGSKPDDAGIKGTENQLKKAATVMNSALNGKSWLVGERLTLADIVAFNILIIAFTFSFDAGVCKAFPNVAAWFAKMSKLPVVARTAGYIKMKGGAPQAGAPQAAPAAGKAGKQKGGKQEAKKEEKKPAKKEEAADEDDFDPFADDDEGEDEQAARLQKIADAANKGKKKKVVIAKSLIIMEIKPWGPEIDLDKLAKEVIADVKMDGLEWKTEYKKEPVAFGVFKIVIGCVVEDAKVSVDDITEQIEGMEDYVQSVDIAAFNKL